MSTTNQTKTVKPCPRCGSAAGAGNGGSLCKCKKGKAKDAGAPSNVAPAPCDAPIGKTAGKGGCGCGKK